MSRNILVVDKEEQKLFFIKSGIKVPVYTAFEYLTNDELRREKSVRVYNLSSSMEYQGIGYYVSLLAMARKHKIFPDVTIIQDLKLLVMQKFYSSELDELVQKKLTNLKGSEFELSIYFGKNLARTYDSLCWQLFNLVKAPIFRVYFKKEHRWHLKSIKLLPFDSLNEVHQDFFISSAEEFLKKQPAIYTRPRAYIYDLAILYNPEEVSPPSNRKAISKFIRAGRRLGLRVDLLTKKEAGRVLEYDGLFLRETTNVNHHTYRIARRAEAEGLVVIDDPDSILKCSNKVFLEEILDKANIRRPKSYIIYHNNYKDIAAGITYPCVVKQPDSSFSEGVFKLTDYDNFLQVCERLFKISDLLIIQEYIPTEYDWRVGVLNNEIIFTCKYYMARGHWQILKHEGGVVDEGNFDTLTFNMVPDNIKQAALKAARLIGKGLYGIDLKEFKDKAYVIEINDNPNIDAGIEDQVSGDRLYERIIRYFIDTLDRNRYI